MGLDASEVKFATQLARSSIRTILAFFVFAFCLTIAERYLSSVYLAEKYELLAKAEALSGQIVLADEKLTNAAVSFAISSNNAWKRSYDQQLPVIDGAIAGVKQLVSAPVAQKFDADTRVANDKLVVMETEVFRLASAKNNYAALALLRGVEYDLLKRTLARGADEMLASLRTEITASLNDAKWLSWGLTALVFLLGAGALAVIWKRLNAALKKSEEAFLASEKQIRDELSDTHDTLLKQSALSQLGQLTATVAHELRNPLGSVRTSAFLLERKFLSGNPAMEGALSRINAGVTRCDNIITQLLDFSRRSKAQTVETKLDDWLASVITEQAESLPPGLNIVCDLGLGDLNVSIDQERMRRVVVNLISNASEAMLPRGQALPVENAAAPKLSIASSKTTRGVDITFADNGPGIAGDVLARIFEPLFTTKSFGTGLGLPAVQKIVEQHGGGLDVKSEPGHGTAFTVWLPTAPHVEDAGLAA
jgi:signal transduction histidine kinase